MKSSKKFRDAIESFSVLDRLDIVAAYLQDESASDQKIRFSGVCSAYESLGFPSVNQPREFERFAKKRGTQTQKKDRLVKASPSGDANFQIIAVNILNRPSVTPIIIAEDYLSAHIGSIKRDFGKRIWSELNFSYANHQYNAAAVLLRRFLEISLILAYRHGGVESSITNSRGGITSLREIVRRAPSDLRISFSRDEVDLMNSVRELGNLSIHSLEYTTPSSSLKRVQLTVEALIQKILNYSDLLK